MAGLNRFLPLLSVLFFLSTRIWIMTWPPVISDTWFYYQLSMKSVWDHLVIYVDYPFGYPILAWLSIKWPAYQDLHLSFEEYRFSFRLWLCMIEVLLVTCAGFWCIQKKKDLLFFSKTILLYTLFSLCLGNLLYDRIDLFVAIALCAIFLTWSGSLSLGISFLFGFMYKIVPLGLWPFKFAELFRVSRKRALISVWMPVACILSFVIADATIYPEFIKSMSSHGERGIQVESVWALPYYFEKILGYDDAIAITKVGGADEIDPAVIPDSVMFLAKYTGFAVFGLIGLIFLWKKIGLEDAVKRNDFILLFIFTFLALQRVLSPQFLIWATPFLAISLVFRWSWTLFLLAAIEHVLTYVNFGEPYWHLVKFETWAVVLLTLRDLSILAIFLLLLVRFFAGLKPRKAV